MRQRLTTLNESKKKKRQMFSPQAVLFRLHQEEAPLWIIPAGPTWGKMVCSQALMWPLARWSHRVCPRYGRFGIADQSPSRRGIRPSWWSVQQRTVRQVCWLDVTLVHHVQASFIHRGAWCKRWNRVHYHFSKDASQTPDVDSCGVVFTTQENFWCSVPKCYHLRNITEMHFELGKFNY